MAANEARYLLLRLNFWHTSAQAGCCLKCRSLSKHSQCLSTHKLFYRLWRSGSQFWREWPSSCLTKWKSLMFFIKHISVIFYSGFCLRCFTPKTFSCEQHWLTSAPSENRKTSYVTCFLPVFFTGRIWNRKTLNQFILSWIFLATWKMHFKWEVSVFLNNFLWRF